MRWCNLGFSGRGKILINIVNELVGKHDMKGGSTQGSVGAVTSSELDQIIKQLHFWATDCDRHNGIVQVCRRI